jgi:cell volume regulation protein A
MEYPFEKILLVVSLLLFISILASKTSGKLGIPVLVMFLAIGMLAGEGGIGVVNFNNPEVAQALGAVSLAFILFSGGLDTRLQSIRPVLARGIALSTVGVFLTAVLIGVFVSWVTDFSLLEGLLLGAIVSSTDAAAVFAILRNKGMALKRYLRPTLELESGSNDPMAYFLTISFTYLLVNPAARIESLIPIFLQQMLVGGLMGWFTGKIMAWILNHIHLAYEGLYPVLLISLVLFTFSLTSTLQGNGFLAVYVSAIMLGNTNFAYKSSLIKFFDGFAWLMQILMFITLGLLIIPRHIWSIAEIGFVIAAYLIIIARPLAVFASLVLFKISIKEKAFISWVGLRGAVPIVFATYPLLEGVTKADMIFNLVFFIVITSVLFQGTTLPFVAKALGLGSAEQTHKQCMPVVEATQED